MLDCDGKLNSAGRISVGELQYYAIHTPLLSSQSDTGPHPAPFWPLAGVCLDNEHLISFIYITAQIEQQATATNM